MFVGDDYRSTPTTAHRSHASIDRKRTAPHLATVQPPDVDDSSSTAGGFRGPRVGSLRLQNCSGDRWPTAESDDAMLSATSQIRADSRPENQAIPDDSDVLPTARSY